ncbi:hypothetical protein [Streptomyces cupreus]|uniref:SMI1/KNR4 family protein n=1 Tax=Streptomyces cupreus TaxID=2759956 RepID=A0A7X1IX12_9ACTN|nr:hypothetical protein [Streptomyces cupreus]MBC2900135.1 hypothetical protein [Streptomyces cupreus]
MTDLNAAERGLRLMMSELRETSEFEVHDALPGVVDPACEDVDAAFAGIMATTGVALDDGLKNCFVRFDRLSACWDLEGSENGLSGEFCISHLPAVIATEAPPSAPELMTEDERQRYAQFRVLDDHPVSGTGAFAALRLNPESPTPEIWYHDFHYNLGGFRMALDYCRYLDVLTLTKGTFGWQFLFCDVSFTDDDFLGLGDELGEMLAVFPRLFPDRDYTDLRARLEERL